MTDEFSSRLEEIRYRADRAHALLSTMPASVAGQLMPEVKKAERLVEEDIPFLLAEVERLQALDEAITYVRSLYPESVFRPDSDSIDARSADMARRTCDNIRRTAEELRVGKER